MSKMKHLLRKLHIGGGGVTGHQRLVDARPVDSAPTVPPSTSSSIESDRAVADASTSTSGGGGAADFNFLEEEFQVQLALAISASDPDGDGSAQIDVAKRISLGCTSTAPAADPASLVDSLSLRYWSYNVVNYNEKVIDGFYDVHCISSSSLVQGKMPSLVELKALDSFDYEVVLVNRLLDPKLRELEKRVYIMSLESRFAGGLGFSGLVQKIADVVVQRMGGPVGDAEKMSRRWKTRNSELRTSLNSIILPLGCLDVGLSRHRALLFKVLADKVNLPCMLIKGSYYTGTDDGAVDLIRIDDGSELIIDLMGAPGSLIPVEVPSSHILNAGFGVRGFPGLTEATGCSSFLPGDRPETLGFPTSLGRFPEMDILKSEEALFPVVVTNEVRREKMLQCHSDNVVSCLGENLISLTEDVSSGMIASGHKEENSTSFPIEQQTDVEISLLSDTASEGLVLLHNSEENKLVEDCTGFYLNFLRPRRMVEKSVHGNRIHESSLPSEMDSCKLRFKQTTNSNDKKCPHDEMEIRSDAEVGKQSGMKLIETERSNLVLGEGADWEILWENLQIGERIGIGSYGEVYHAELNGTEVAVKKFLDQDFSGDALMQFKCEIEIMLRLRHPNVVLFMGAVTTPPNLSILTEFLPRGSLYRLLHRPNCPIDEKRRLRMAIDVAKGMNYLHTSHPTIVHRDLKSPNLLVDKNWNVKVCDFGLSRLKHHTFLSSKSTAGTPEWMAPEVLRNEPASEKCDIYSFGVILWELANCQIPWKDLNPMQVVGAVGFQNRHLEIPNHIDPSVARIIQDCWQMEPHLRPSFSQLISRLRRVQRLHIQKNTL